VKKAGVTSVVRLHLILTLLWALLVIPTLLWWRESVFWVALMSLYANFGTHWSAYQAARAEATAGQAAKEAMADLDSSDEVLHELEKVRADLDIIKQRIAKLRKPSDDKPVHQS
jgi:ABC-type transport system involved in cytochrome bd biosynthesis fused ATPase/permease subunit